LYCGLYFGWILICGFSGLNIGAYCLLGCHCWVFFVLWNEAFWADVFIFLYLFHLFFIWWCKWCRILHNYAWWSVMGILSGKDYFRILQLIFFCPSGKVFIGVLNVCFDSFFYIIQSNLFFENISTML